MIGVVLSIALLTTADENGKREQRGEELACSTPIPNELSVRDVRALLAAVRLHSQRPVHHIERSYEPCKTIAPSSGKGPLPRPSSEPPRRSIAYFTKEPPFGECAKPPVPTYAVVVIATGDCTTGEGDTFHARRVKRTWRVHLFGKRTSGWDAVGGGSVE